MLIRDIQEIGNNLLMLRRKKGLTQAELAERAGLSDRTYADIERGTTNMRIRTLLAICDALEVMPNDILVSDDDMYTLEWEELTQRLNGVDVSDQETALKLLKVYLDSLTRHL